MYPEVNLIACSVVDRLQQLVCMMIGERKWMDGSVGLIQKGKQQWASDEASDSDDLWREAGQESLL